MKKGELSRAPESDDGLPDTLSFSVNRSWPKSYHIGQSCSVREVHKPSDRSPLFSFFEA